MLQETGTHAESPLPPAILRGLGDRSYDKRKTAALDVTSLIKSLQEAGECSNRRESWPTFRIVYDSQNQISHLLYSSLLHDSPFLILLLLYVSNWLISFPGERECISNVINLLAQEFTRSRNVHHRKGGKNVAFTFILMQKGSFHSTISHLLIVLKELLFSFLLSLQLFSISSQFWLLWRKRKVTWNFIHLLPMIFTLLHPQSFLSQYFIVEKWNEA